MNQVLDALKERLNPSLMKVTQVDIPAKGLKKRALEYIGSLEGHNFEFAGGVRLQFANVRYHVWAFVPPKGVYTDYELEQLAQKVFDELSKKRMLSSPNVISVGIEDEAMLVIEAIGSTKK